MICVTGRIWPELQEGYGPSYRKDMARVTGRIWPELQERYEETKKQLEKNHKHLT